MTIQPNMPTFNDEITQEWLLDAIAKIPDKTDGDERVNKFLNTSVIYMHTVPAAAT